MLNVKGLSAFLSNNTIPDLYSSLYVLSLTGSIIAYSIPNNTRPLRDQAALIQLSWTDHATQSNTPLKALIFESEAQSIIVRALRNSYVLVLVGPGTAASLSQLSETERGEEPRIEQGNLKATPEFEGGDRYPAALSDEDSRIEAWAGKAARSSGNGEDAANESGGVDGVTILLLQRRKAESLATFLDESTRDAGAIEDGDYGKLFS